MHYFYALYSEKVDRYYYGSSHDPLIRLMLHNAGATRSTKNGIPWRIVYTEEYQTSNRSFEKRERN